MPNIRIAAPIAALAAALILLGAGCAAPHATRAPGDVPQPATTGQSLYEQRLLRAIEAESTLETYAARADADPPTVERRFQETVRLYAEIIADNPESVEALLLQGKLLVRYGDTSGALPILLAALRLDPSIAVTHQQLATCYAESGDSGQALVHALAAVDRAPDEPVYHYGLGELLYAYAADYVATGAFSRHQLEDSMLAAFATAARLDPANTALQFRYGETFYDHSRPDWESAHTHWLALLQHPDLTPLQRDAIRLHLGRCALALDRAAEARAWAAQVASEGLLPSRDALLESIPP
jgi:tetratricopeptide (TPR) repeat protein